MTPTTETGMPRRSFLASAIALIGAAVAAVLGGSGGAYVLSPLFRKDEEEWVDVGPAASIERGKPVKVEFTQRRKDAWATSERRGSAWVVTADGKQFIAYDPRCTHLGCPYRWEETKQRFMCPCHSAAFGVDGAVVAGPPPRPLDRFPVKVAGGRLLLRPAKQEEKA